MSPLQKTRPLQKSMPSTQIKENKLKTTKIVMELTITATVVKQSLTLTTKIPIIAIPTTQTPEMTKNRKLSAHYVRPEAEPTTPQENAIVEPMQQIERVLGLGDRWD